MSPDLPAADQDRVVVGVDGSEPSKHALRWARFLAEATSSTIEVVTAWQTPMAYGWAGSGLAGEWIPAKDAEQAADDALQEVFGQQRPPSLQVTVAQGNPAKVLLDVSAGARMLVVGSRGHGGFTGLLLGSVSAACAEHATCPVLVLHGRATPPPPA